MAHLRTNSGKHSIDTGLRRYDEKYQEIATSTAVSYNDK